MKCFADCIEIGSNHYSKEEITSELLIEIKERIVVGSINRALASYKNDTPFLEIDIKNGWAAIMISDEKNGIWYYFRNKQYDDLTELAPVYFGGQSEAPKPITCDDLTIAANIFEEWVIFGTRFSTTWACYTSETDSFIEW